jgi:hypothetical protein
MALDPNRLADTPPSTVPSAETPHRLWQPEQQLGPSQQVFADRGPQDNVGSSSYSLGPGLFDPTVAAAGGGQSWASGITAAAGGTRPAAVKLTSAINRISVCATAADSVALPPAVGGQEVSVINSGAAACQVFAAIGTSDTINGVAAATGISLAAAGKAQFISPGPGLWFSILSA